MNLLHRNHHLSIPLLLLSLLLLTLHPTSASTTALPPAIDPTTTPGFASLDTCIQLCFTGGALSAHNFGTRVGCATKACVCDAAAAAAVEEYMETCASVSCAKPRRLEWWKRGAWKKIFERYCEGVWGSEVEVEGGVEGW
ncbi:uncharacterized protein H6S33_006637 [Morchella sextelata]|uniref:uncharacterized protein n=1 Tax=Morchella sextelata TaxID=1174677 RepID=UPI001D0556FF|nr:uncharacterized protein H6S33_006637 [Morchella sextelata]KAH0604260.1 hypothetical protein H6S33_006637 [Morchella sextelata]